MFPSTPTGLAPTPRLIRCASPSRASIHAIKTTAALEVLFHEASHGIAEPVEQAIVRECHQRDKAIPRDLWHALVFYTTGEVIRR